ncbi:hypothetical protein SARC_03452 [Sphaeroforma arctica JP610]|uniref:Uncharacterized protein n=1 Tax=Sphaeroforma arctica JP610 TaxID=667725 RepID=A0A0L0G7V8_9EUKA|nr:hypothetical protein SARC_03452 [Sphaeroforma arctica JP610]KNC84328.1 hypothetical protein SARC_03452 [Sphaeroforma arctica JP610]|eukprot:XP_014158230.1 hypothetical protein SARC_03452 [Sphaeroforma arctica JP610]
MTIYCIFPYHIINNFDDFNDLEENSNCKEDIDSEIGGMYYVYQRITDCLCYRSGSTRGARVDCEDRYLDAADPNVYCSAIADNGGTLVPGTLCLLRPEQAHPTQLAVGKAAALCHRRQFENMSSKQLKKYIRKNLVPVFVGYNQRLYISDKHHMSYALHQANLEFKNNMLHRAMYVCVCANLDIKNNMLHRAMYVCV